MTCTGQVTRPISSSTADAVVPAFSFIDAVEPAFTFYWRGRPRTAWIDNIKSWTGLSVEESIRMTEDRDKWREYVHGVANPRIKEG